MRDLTALSDSERLAMGEAGRALVEKQFTWESVASQMKEVYAWMLGEGEKPGCVV
jgi:glycosyltransferase involved in cell wall biosynthesis